MTDIYEMTKFVSLYQAGEGIYQQFDKVLVIDAGRKVYFGPTAGARQYFVDMGWQDFPRQTTADYLTGWYVHFSLFNSTHLKSVLARILTRGSMPRVVAQQTYQVLP